MEIATTLVLEWKGKEMTVSLQEPMSLPEVYYLFRSRGYNPIVYLTKGIARVTF